MNEKSREKIIRVLIQMETTQAMDNQLPLESETIKYILSCDTITEIVDWYRSERNWEDSMIISLLDIMLEEVVKEG